MAYTPDPIIVSGDNPDSLYGTGVRINANFEDIAEAISGSTLTSSAMYVKEFTYASLSPLTLCTVSEDQVVTSVQILVATPFDDIGATLSIGHTGDAGALLAVTENMAYTAGTYECKPDILYGGADTIRLYITPNGATAGAGKALVAVANLTT